MWRKLVKILVTGAAGFIGFHTAKALLERGDEVVGSTTSTPTTIPSSRRRASRCCERDAKFRFAKLDIADRAAMQALFDARAVRARGASRGAGRRALLDRESACCMSEQHHGFLHVLEGCRHSGVEHLVYASTSSVYGANTRMPFSEQQNVDHPLTLYAATKKANELMAHSYSSLYGLPTTGLALLHGLRTLGKARHGAVPVHARTSSPAADRRVQRRPPSARLHLHRRHRPGRARARSTTPRRRIPAGTPAQPDPGDQLRAVQDLQHRQPAARDAAALHRGARAMPRAQARTRTCCRMQLGDVPDTWADVDALAREVGIRPAPRWRRV